MLLATRILLVLAIILIIIPAVIVLVWDKDEAALPAPVEDSIMMAVYITSTEQLKMVGLEEYVGGVVAAEMPALFEAAALEAQAVAARTYVLRRARQFGGAGCNKHALADVCDDPGHCQAYHPQAVWPLKWGMVAHEEYAVRIVSAVERTRGLVLSYAGRLIDPIFHSTCGGHTEDAHKVWSNTYAYLTSVECGYCQHSPRFTESYSYTPQSLAALLKSRDHSIEVSAGDLSTPGQAIQITSRSPTGRVLELRVGKTAVKGTTFRGMLGLNSTNFTIEWEGEGLVIKTTGYGHGVGLCQYGADGMARSGKTFEQILAHYYRGVQIVPFRP